MEQESLGQLTNLSIRAFRKEDVADVIKIHLELFGSHSGFRFLEKAYYPTFFLSPSTGFCFVAYFGGKLSGFCNGALNTSEFHRNIVRSHPWECLTAAARMIVKGRKIWKSMADSFKNLYSSPVNPAGGHIFFIAVLKAFHQKGIASKLVFHALDHCRSQGLERCWSRALKTNTASYQLHTHLGFRVHPEMSRRNKNRFVFYHDLNENLSP